MDSVGSLEELVSAVSARQTAIGEGLWTGTWMPEVDRGRGEVSGS